MAPVELHGSIRMPALCIPIIEAHGEQAEFMPLGDFRARMIVNQHTSHELPLGSRDRSNSDCQILRHDRGGTKPVYCEREQRLEG
jgi:hypothetical protein